MAVATHAEGLRELADWLEENEEVLRSNDFSGNVTLLLCRIDKDEFIATVQALDVEQSEVDRDGKYLNVSRRFGPIRVQVYIDHEKVGTAETKLRPTTEWELDADVRALFEPREPTDEEFTRGGPHVMDARSENDRSL